MYVCVYCHDVSVELFDGNKICNAHSQYCHLECIPLLCIDSVVMDRNGSLLKYQGDRTKIVCRIKVV